MILFFSIFLILIFSINCLFAIYLIVLLVWSKGLTISPTISSDSKSIKVISKYIQNYILQNQLKKIRILDIGSGYGKILSSLEKDLKQLEISKEFVGYEIAKFPYKISKSFNKFEDIKFINDDIFKLKDFNFNIVISFLLLKQQESLLDIYRKFPKETLIMTVSLPIPFEKKDSFKLIETIKVHYNWNIYIYKN